MAHKSINMAKRLCLLKSFHGSNKEKKIQKTPLNTGDESVSEVMPLIDKKFPL